MKKRVDEGLLLVVFVPGHVHLDMCSLRYSEGWSKLAG